MAPVGATTKESFDPLNSQLVPFSHLSTVFFDDRFYSYLTSLIDSNRKHVSLRIHTFLINFPAPDSPLHKFYQVLNTIPNTIIVGTTSYVNQKQLLSEISRIKKFYPRLNIHTTYNDHRKLFLFTQDRYSGAILLERTHRLWLSTCNLHETRSKNLTIEVLDRQQIDVIRQEISI